MISGSNYSPLVSVIISTYNSSIYILETLESITKQSWKDLELIVTDDFSKDDTVEVCREWISKNGNRFKAVKILTSEKNTGVSTNANRGLSVAKGDWIKFLGADDTLKPECIEDNMKWISCHDEVKVLFSRIEIYKDKFEPQNFIETTPGDMNNPAGIMAPGRSAESQYKMLLLCDRIHFSPSVFLHRETLLSIGGFDERFRFLEDYPLWLKLTRKGHKLFFMDKVTVNYRRHSKAINNTGINYLINPNYFRSENFRKEYTYPYLPADLRRYQRFNWYVSQVFRVNFMNHNRLLNRFFLTILTTYMNPFKYYIFLKKHYLRNLQNNEFYK